MHRSQGATAALGMCGFVYGAQVEVDGELWLKVETTPRSWVVRAAAQEPSATG